MKRFKGTHKRLMEDGTEKFSTLLCQKLAKKMQKNYDRATQLNGVPSISSKTLAFPSLL